MGTDIVERAARCDGGVQNACPNMTQSSRGSKSVSECACVPGQHAGLDVQKFLPDNTCRTLKLLKPKAARARCCPPSFASSLFVFKRFCLISRGQDIPMSLMCFALLTRTGLEGVGGGPCSACPEDAYCQSGLATNVKRDRERAALSSRFDDPSRPRT